MGEIAGYDPSHPLCISDSSDDEAAPPRGSQGSTLREESTLRDEKVPLSDPRVSILEEERKLPDAQVPLSDPTLREGPVLCEEQQRLVDLIMRGKNVFYTGSAGCGKSTVLKHIVRELEAREMQVHVIAPTGRAALQVGGTSTWSYMGWTPDHHKEPLQELLHGAWRKNIKRRIRNTDVLIIDEISMVENHHLERINACMKHIRYWDQNVKGTAFDAPAFGGAQVILTGDFCQLPPVKPFQFCIYCGTEMMCDEDGLAFNCSKNHGPFLETEKWAFCSDAWREGNFEHVHLNEIHRQRDKPFIQMLQKCRLGVQLSNNEIDVLMDHPCNVAKATRLLCTREEVARFNTTQLESMRTPKNTYYALDGFECNRPEHAYSPQYRQRNWDGTLPACKDNRLEAVVTLRAGMLVILQQNLEIGAGLVNGSQGIICGFEAFVEGKPEPAKGEHKELRDRQIVEFMNVQKERHARETQAASTNPSRRVETGIMWPRVLFHNGKKRTIYASCTVNSIGDQKPYSLLHRTQIPLVPGWALSIHKSQGMTLDRVIVDISRAFEEGQVYVALSRATSLDGLKIIDTKGILRGRFNGNDEVRKFLDDNFSNQLPLIQGSQGSVAMDTSEP